MKEHKSRTHDQQEQSDHEHHPTKRNSRPSSDNLRLSEQDGISITESPFEPTTGSHAALLAQAQSDDQRASLIRQLHQSYGNAYVQRLLTSIGAQAKLTISAPDDIYEQEADRVAQSVVKALDSVVQRQEEEEELQVKPASDIQRQEEPEEEEELMMKADRDGAVQLSEAIETRIEAARTGGEPLPHMARASLEPILGYDFSGVCVHADAEADTLSRQLEAEAFTTGHDIFFRKGAYQPDSVNGKSLLAHELTHVAQQQAAPMVQRTDGGTTAVAEGEATTAAAPATAPATAALRALWDSTVIDSVQQAHTALTGTGTQQARARRAVELLHRAEDTISTIRPSYSDNTDTYARLNWAHSRLETIRIGLQAYSGQRMPFESLTQHLDSSSNNVSLLSDIRERL